MIKKSVFEDDLIKGMQSELVKQAHNVEVQDLSAAADYLNSAVQILDEVGMVEASDKILNILLKVADTSQKVVHKGFPSMQVFLEAGLTTDDLQNISSNIFVKAKVIEILRKLKYTDQNIIQLLGEKNFLSAAHSRAVIEMQNGDPTATAKINAYLRNMGSNDAEIISTIGFKHHMPEREVKKHLTTPALDVVPKVYKKESPKAEIIEKLEPYELEITANTKPRNPAKISDRHTKGLTSEKMVNNLKHHGTVFNMADDGFNDVLNADIDDDLVVSENDLMQIGDFEDEID